MFWLPAVLGFLAVPAARAAPTDLVPASGIASPLDPFFAGFARATAGLAAVPGRVAEALGFAAGGAATTVVGVAIFLGIVAGLVFLIKKFFYRIRLRFAIRGSADLVFLRVMIPKKSHQESDRETQKDLKGVLALAGQFFDALGALGPRKNFFDGRAYGVELTATESEVGFFLTVPGEVADFFERQITAFYPTAFVERVRGENIFSPENSIAGAEFSLARENFKPIRGPENFDSDPIDGIVNALSKFAAGEGGAVQILFRPASDAWADRGRKFVEEKFQGKKSGKISAIFDVLLGRESKPATPPKLTPREEENLKAVSEKCADQGFEVRVRALISAKNPANAEIYLRAITGAFAQFREPERNEIRAEKMTGRALRRLVRDYIFRIFPGKKSPGILTGGELALLFHFPNPRFNHSDAIKWQLFKLAPAPARLPEKGVLLGENLHRGERRKIFIPEKDRFRHLYVIGQTGQGKSVTLTNLALQDLMQGAGLCVMDPHGDMAKDLLNFVPKERAEDVIYFNPADTERPMGLNILETDGTVEEKDFITLEALNIMLKLFGEEIFSPRLQDYFRNGVLALLDSPEGGAITDVVTLFVNESFQKKVRATIKNPVVRSWWDDTYDAMGKNEKEEMIPYFAAKFGQFITNSTVRNVIGQVKSSFSVTEAMDSGKILLVNLSKGSLGDINSSLLGMIIVTKIQVAAMRRNRLPEDQRRPFYFYIDEFQNFVTDSIESILSEARKYKLSLNVAHQYIDQLVDKSGKDQVKKAIFGNVGSMISLKVSAGDAEYLEKEFAPVFSQQDLLNFDAFHGAAKISVDNKPTQPFSLAVTKPWERPWKSDEKLGEAIGELARLKYGRKREIVEKEILGRLGMLEPKKKPEAAAKPKFDFAKMLADMRAKREAAGGGTLPAPGTNPPVVPGESFAAPAQTAAAVPSPVLASAGSPPTGQNFGQNPAGADPANPNPAENSPAPGDFLPKPPTEQNPAPTPGENFSPVPPAEPGPPADFEKPVAPLAQNFTENPPADPTPPENPFAENRAG